MIWIILGVALWSAAHYLKRVARGLRASLGNAGKGLVAVLNITAIVLMVIGYKAADVAVLWDLGGWTVKVNNALMLVAVALFILRRTNSRLREMLRHPQLNAFLIFIFAHLLVNGDLASLVLFGGLGLWALGAIVLINRAEPEYEPWHGGTKQGDIWLVIISIVAFAIIAGIHTWLGVWPFSGLYI